MKKVLAFFFTLFLLLTLVTSVDARSGCCSWHGGVCGCGCCDGTPLSSTCAPYYPCGGNVYIPPIYVPPPPPRPQVNCQLVTARNTFYPNTDGTFKILFDWDDIQSAKSYSIALYNYAFGDPGPNIDTVISQWTFNGIRQGNYHVAIKSGINGYWSNICDWSIEVPKWYPPPTPTSIPTPTNEPFMSGVSSEDRAFINGIELVLILFIAYKVNKKYQILKKLTSSIDLSEGQVFSNALITWVMSIVCFLILLLISNADFSDKSWVLIVLVLCTVGVGVIAFAIMGISFCLIVLKKIIGLFK